MQIPKMSSSFVAAEDNTELAIVFSAEARTDGSGTRMFVRALIDGVVADPSDVVFTEGSFGGATSFIFAGAVDAGIHTVEMQWLVDPGGTGYLRHASLMLRHAGPGSPGVLTYYTPPSGPEPSTTTPAWQPIPDTSIDFYMPVEGTPIVSFSAETHVGGNRRMFIRAKIDGVPLSPGDVVFAQRSERVSHAMRFGGQIVSEGWHTAEIEWLHRRGWRRDRRRPNHRGQRVLADVPAAARARDRAERRVGIDGFELVVAGPEPVHTRPPARQRRDRRLLQWRGDGGERLRAPDASQGRWRGHRRGEGRHRCLEPPLRGALVHLRPQARLPAAGHP